MKMRASLQFAVALGSVIFLAVTGLVVTNRAITARARLDAQPSSQSDVSSQVRAQYGRLPLAFEANEGQTAPQVQFLSHGAGYELFLTHQDAVLALRQAVSVPSPRANRVTYLRELRKAERASKTSVLQLHFVGANPSAAVEGVNRLPGRTDYFIGKDPRNWHTSVPSYAQVEYRGIYPGVDAVFYGNQKQLEYDLRMSPGAKLGQVAFEVQGADRLSIDPLGNLLMHVADSDVLLTKPAAYQDFNGQRREVAANYRIAANNRVTFSVADYDSTKMLVIDPVLDYSTYLGGSAGNTTNGNDSGFGIAVDSKGDAYVTGQTFSLTFPTAATISGYNTTSPLVSNPNGAVFVSELNPAGTAQLYATYLIGTPPGGDFGLALALDPSGNIYVTGVTFSQGFPLTANAAENTAPANVTTNGTAFISKINPSVSGTNSLIYSSFLGGTGGDVGFAIAADANSNAYVAGFTNSTDFLTTVTAATGYQTSNLDPSEGVGFLATVNTVGSGPTSVTYSTYLGGNGANAGNSVSYGDSAYGVAADSTGNAYVVGETTSTNFPTLNGLQNSSNASNLGGEAFVSVIATTQTGQNSLLYSTYLGGENFDLATAVSLEPGNARPANAIYVTGTTASTQFPITTGAYASTIGASGVAFVTVLDTTQSGANSLKYSAAVGGSSGDEGNGIQADSSGNAYVVGTTSSSDFPVTPGAFQVADNNAQGTAFVFELNPGGNGAADLFYSTFFGGTGPGGDSGFAIALGPSNNAYITGSTGSTDLPIFPTTATPPAAFQTTLTGSDHAAIAAAFVAELTLQPTVAFSTTTLAFGNVPINTTQPACGGLNPCTVTITNNTNAAIPLTIGPIAATPPSVATDFAASSTCGTPAVIASGGNCTITVTFTPTVVQAETVTLPVVYTAGGNAAATQNITLTGTGTVFTVAPPGLTFPTQLITSTSTPAQTVTLTNTSAASINFTTAATAGFAEADNCGGSVATGAICTLNVTFTPTAAGPVTGTLTVTSGGQVQTVQLTGTGGDFSVTMPASIAVTSNAGSGSATLAATPNGFTPSVSFTCTTTVPNGSCTALTTTAPGSFTISVSVSAAVPPMSQRFDGWRLVRPLGLLALMLALFSLPFIRRHRAWLGFATLLVVIGLFSACTGPNKSANTYSLSLTASSTSNGTTVSHNYTTPVTVN